MDRDESLALFESLTGAPPHVAEHVLDAHGWDVNSAVEWFLESGGVGHGGAAGAGGGPAADDGFGGAGMEGLGGPAGFLGAHDLMGAAGLVGAAAGAGGVGAAGYGAAPASPPDYIEEPDDDVVVEQEEEQGRAGRNVRGGAGFGGFREGGGGGGGTASRPLPASARPRSSPIEILDDDEDDDMAVLASSLGRRRPNRIDQLSEEGVQHVGSVEDDLQVGSQGRRVRRNRRRVAGEVDRDLELLGQRFGVMDEYQPAPSAARQQQQQRQQQGPGVGPAFANGQSGDEELPMLPDDVNLEEQRMLMAAIQGGGYEGELPDFSSDPRYQQRVLSPGAQARESLRAEQDYAYYESLRADKEKAEAAEVQRREEQEAAAAAQAAAQAEARQQAEEAERLERDLRSKQASLPAEPPADDPEGINLAVRLPAGGRYARRFRRSDPLQAVFDFVDVESGHAGAAAGGPPPILPGSYHLATSYPRRVLQQDGAAASFSLADAGLAAKQEALFLELK